MPLLCFASPKGGVGKTTMAANVASELARLGHRVIALDLDHQNTLGLHFGMKLRDGRGFMSAVLNGAEPAAAWQVSLRPVRPNLSYIPHGRVGMHEALHIASLLTTARDALFAPLRQTLADRSTIVIADLPPGTSPVLAAVMPLVTLLVAVLLVDGPSVAQIPAIEGGLTYASDSADGLPLNRVAFVLNQMDVRTRLGRAAGDAASRHLGSRLLGMVYRDENIREAAAAQRLISDYAPASKAGADIALIARNIIQRMSELGDLPVPEQAAQ
jgi:cellulose synthase operon protein YhjQ